MSASERWETEGSGSAEPISHWEQVDLSCTPSVSSYDDPGESLSHIGDSPGVDHESSFEAEVLSRYPEVEVFGYDFSVVDVSHQCSHIILRVFWLTTEIHSGVLRSRQSQSSNLGPTSSPTPSPPRTIPPRILLCILSRVSCAQMGTRTSTSSR